MVFFCVMWPCSLGGRRWCRSVPLCGQELLQAPLKIADHVRFDITPLLQADPAPVDTAQLAGTLDMSQRALESVLIELQLCGVHAGTAETVFTEVVERDAAEVTQRHRIGVAR